MAVATDRVLQYQQDGVLFPIDLFSDDEIAGYRREFDRLDQTEGVDRPQARNRQRQFDLEFVWRMASHPTLIALMQELMGPDLLLLATDFFVKYGNPETKAFVAWHQDVTYWGLEPPDAHTAWIAVDDSDIENGCMRVIPGSHRHGIATHGTSQRAGNQLSINQEIPDKLVDSSSALDLELRAGQISVHDGHLFHASQPNRSHRRRCGMTVRFVRPNVQAENSLGSMAPDPGGGRGLAGAPSPSDRDTPAPDPGGDR